MQSLIDFLYRHPKAKIRLFKRFGGYFNYQKMIAAREQMQAAAAGLSPISSVSDGLPLYFLTGKNYFHQTLFCIRSLVITTETKFRLILVDDGSFDIKLINQITKQLPGADIFTREDIEQNLKRVIPVEIYPYLHHKRMVYPHIKKLTDIHSTPGGGWKLVLDSDMLFWRKPQEMLEWLANPQDPLHMIDCDESYGYSKKLMQELSGKKIKPLVNVGAVGLKSDNINWAELENWTVALEKKEGTSYYLEQALTAMLIGEQITTVLPADKYVVNPSESAIATQIDILHHYVDLSKEGYYKHAWKKLI